MRRRAQDEYLFAFGFALIVSLFLAVVIWSTGIERKSANQFPVHGDGGGEVAVDSSDPKTAATFADFSDPARRVAETEVSAGHSLSSADRTEETQSRVASQLPPAPREQTTPITPAGPSSSSNDSNPVSGSTTASSGWRGGAPFIAGAGGGGGSYPAGRPKVAPEAEGVSGEAPHATTQSTSRQHLTVADTASAASEPKAHVSGESASGGSPSISTLTPALAATLDNLIPPAAAFDDVASLEPGFSSSVSFEDSKSIFTESALATPDPIAQLIESYGDPLTHLAEPDLGIEPPTSIITTQQNPVANPEPASLLLLGTGLALIAQRLRRRGEPTAKPA